MAHFSFLLTWGTTQRSSPAATWRTADGCRDLGGVGWDKREERGTGRERVRKGGEEDSAAALPHYWPWTFWTGMRSQVLPCPLAPSSPTLPSLTLSLFFCFSFLLSCCCSGRHNPPWKYHVTHICCPSPSLDLSSGDCSHDFSTLPPQSHRKCGRKKKKRKERSVEWLFTYFTPSFFIFMVMQWLKSFLGMKKERGS